MAVPHVAHGLLPMAKLPRCQVARLPASQPVCKSTSPDWLWNWLLCRYPGIFGYCLRTCIL